MFSAVEVMNTFETVKASTLDLLHPLSKRLVVSMSFLLLALRAVVVRESTISIFGFFCFFSLIPLKCTTSHQPIIEKPPSHLTDAACFHSVTGVNCE